MMRTGASGTTSVQTARFDDTHELEAVLADNPRLLVAENASPPFVACRQLALGEAGSPPLLLLDLQSVPILVEAGAGGSDASGPALISRGLDHLLALTQMTARQVDEAAGGGLVAALRDISGDDTETFSRCWARFAANLAAVRVRLILAVDQPWPRLQPVIEFLAKQTRFGVQCVVVAKSRGVNGDACYTSTVFDPRRDLSHSHGPGRTNPLLRLVPPVNRKDVDGAWRLAWQPTADSRFDLARVRWDG
jgi:hypothetical protein